MRAWRIGKILGIDILIDPSWILIFLFLVWQLATGFFSVELLPLRSRGGLNVEIIGLAVIASLLLFVSVLLHELAHSYLAQYYKIPVISITLFIFGGVAQIGEEPERPRVEFFIAIAGPIMSFLLALFFGAFWVWPLWLREIIPAWREWLLPLSLVGQYLTISNAALAAFNLLPGFPLDGGRVFRALLWAVMHDLRRATRVAMYVGRGIAAAMIGVGLLSLIRPTFFGLNGLMLALVGGFVWSAAGEANTQVEWSEMFRRILVGQIMSRDFPHIAPTLSLDEFVLNLVLARRNDTFIVQADAQALGWIDLQRLRAFPREQWRVVTVQQAMIPLDDVGHIRADDTALSAYKKLVRANADNLAVRDASGAWVGLIGHDDFARYMQLERFK